jgi:hypothetical protein
MTMSSGRGVVGENPGVRCARSGCLHPYIDHAPGGGNCRYWFPLNGDHCGCHGFQWVSLDADPAPPRLSRS